MFPNDEAKQKGSAALSERPYALRQLQTLTKTTKAATACLKAKKLGIPEDIKEAEIYFKKCLSEQEAAAKKSVSGWKVLGGLVMALVAVAGFLLLGLGIAAAVGASSGAAGVVIGAVGGIVAGTGAPVAGVLITSAVGLITSGFGGAYAFFKKDKQQLAQAEYSKTADKLPFSIEKTENNPAESPAPGR